MRNFRIYPIVTVVVGILVFVTTASADVTVKQKLTTTMLGGMMSSEGTTTTYISGDKQKIDSKMKTMMSMFSGPETKTASIMRLDKDLVWNLDHRSKSYTEMTFEQMKAMTASAGDQMQQSGGGDQMPDAGDFEMGKPEFSIDKTGKTDKFKGYNCDEIILHMVMHGKNKETGDTGSVVFHDVMWVTKEWKGNDEYLASNKKLIAKMGYGSGSQGWESMLGMMNLDADELESQFSEIDGFPMKQKITMKFTGGLQAESSGDAAEQQEAMKEAAKAMKGLGGLFGKKDKGDKSESKGPSDPTALMEIEIEVESLSTKGIKADEFEIPKGYKKR